MKGTPVSAAVTGLLIFSLAVLLAEGILLVIPEAAIWVPQVLLKAILIVLSLLAIRLILKISWREAGFQAPIIPLKKAKVIFSGMAVGGLATLLIFYSPATGVPLIKQLNPIQFLLIIVVWSSIAEEILIRAVVQPLLKPFEHQQIKLFMTDMSVSVVSSALVFGAIHLSLLFTSADGYTVVITVITTFLLGLLAGLYREKYQSILPAIITHMSFNVGGLITGVIIAILFKILTGELPPT